MAKRQRTVFPAAELVHIWANQGQESGKTRGRLWFDGQWLLYGSNLLAGVIGDVAVITTERFRSHGFGNPANWHTYSAVRATTHKKQYRLPYWALEFCKRYVTRTLQEVAYYRNYVPSDVAGVWAKVVGQLLKARVEAETKARKRKAHRYNTLNSFNQYGDSEGRQILEAMVVLGWMAEAKLTEFTELFERLKFHQDVLDSAKDYSEKWGKVDAARVREHGAFGHESLQKRLERWKAREDEARRKNTITQTQWDERVRHYDERVEEWLRPWGRERAFPVRESSYVVLDSPPDEAFVAGKMQYRFKAADGVERTAYLMEHPADSPMQQPVRLTLRNATGPDNKTAHVLTSLGATVPVDQAMRLLRLVEIVRLRGEDYVVSEGDGEKHKFGYYQLRRVSKEGDVLIGCHEIKWPEIERFRPMLVALEYGEAREE